MATEVRLVGEVEATSAAALLEEERTRSGEDLCNSFLDRFCALINHDNVSLVLTAQREM